MRRREGHLAEDPILESTMPASVGDPVAAANGSQNGGNSLEGSLRAGEPEDEPRGAHVLRGEAPTDEPRGAHVRKGDPLLSVERRALHATTAEAAPVAMNDTPDLGAAHPESAAPDLLVTVQVPSQPSAHVTKRLDRSTKRHGAHATTSRRWRLLPVAGAAGALVVGLGGGAAFAYLDPVLGHGSGSSQTTAGAPVAVAITATTGKADLLPGATGAVYFTLHNSGSSSATFDRVTPGATVVSDNTALCADSYVSIAQSLPDTIPTAVTVSPGGTSGVQSIPDLVKLDADAPSTCQGVTFTVTFSLSGQSS